MNEGERATRRKRDLLRREAYPFPSRSVRDLSDGVGLRFESAISRPNSVEPRRLDRPETGRVTGDARRVYLPSLLGF